MSREQTNFGPFDTFRYKRPFRSDKKNDAGTLGQTDEPVLSRNSMSPPGTMRFKGVAISAAVNKCVRIA